MKIKIKEAYLLILIVLGLISLSVYSTYALFTKEVTIDNVVSFNTSISLSDSNLVEYELVTLNPNETKIIELVVSNSSTSTLYYGCWYETLSINSDITIGMYLEKSNVPSTGTIATTETKTLVVGIVNNSTSTTLVNLGVVGSTTSSLGLSSSRIIITDTFSPSIIVTDEVLAANTTTTTENVNLEYTNPQRYEVTLSPGTYLLETWGAEGAAGKSRYKENGNYKYLYTEGGRGGYSKGTLTLTNTNITYIYVGGQTGFNGGGISDDSMYGSGGGASDIRLGTDSLYARVIVAGGGGGGYAETEYIDNGEYDFYEGYGIAGGSEYIDTCGQQNFPGGLLLDISQTLTTGFGVGGTGGSGGGGGWYGGKSEYGSKNNKVGGGSGSNFVFTKDTEKNTPIGYLLSEKYYLLNATFVTGYDSFKDFSGSTIKGHSGNGAVRISGVKSTTNYSIPVVFGIDDLNITLGENISLTNGVTYACENGLNTCTYVGPSLTETSSLTEGTHIVNYTIKDSNGTLYSYQRKINVVNGIIVTPTLLSQNTTISTSGNLSQETITYEYTTPGTYFMKLNPGVYQLETWGAQGTTNSRGRGDNAVSGGKGGHSVGSITLSELTGIYANVGGQSSLTVKQEEGDCEDSTRGCKYLATILNGYNGAGKGSFKNTTRGEYSAGGGGGGASDIRIGVNSLYSRVIVSGGGSGASWSGGAGINGNAGGGTNAAGTNALFGSGATATTGFYERGAGGGGWYGGGSTSGGSGYVYTSSTASDYPTGCLLNSSYYLTNASTESDIWSGDGKVVITGHEYEKKYTIPRVLGLDDITIVKGESISLTNGVTYACENNSTSCSYIGPDITDASRLELGKHTINYKIKSSSNVIYIYQRTINVTRDLKIDNSGANYPVLTNALIPVVYNESTSKWVKADATSSTSTYGWYDYDQKKWANAILVSSTNRSTYQNASAGTTIADADILAFYVWIPRFKYKVWNINKVVGTQSYNARTIGIDILFESGTTSTGTIKCTYSYATPSSTAGSPNETCTGSNGDYYTHPAFTFGNQELTGFWMGKFELSSSSPTNSNGGGNSSSLTPRILPNVTSWRGNYLNNFNTVVQNMQVSNNIYGLPTSKINTDSHIITNMEWGAVAYLTNSKYGRCTNGSCVEVSLNGYGDVSTYTTKTGCGPISSGSTSYGTTCNAYNTTLGKTASTTGNIYGAYDMSGGGTEYVMSNTLDANNNFNVSNSGFTSDWYTNSNKKYITSYVYGTTTNNQTSNNRTRLGDATGETLLSTVSNGGWYSDYSVLSKAISPWMHRGGSFFGGANSGIFVYYGGEASNSQSNATSRAVLTMVS